MKRWAPTQRITPAWAGKSQGRRAGKRQAQDHPRVGGEKCEPVSWATGPAGSPPRGRGKAAGASVGRLVVGITPAWAGKRYTSTVSMVACWDHPRVGGEKLFDNGTGQGAQGSPPRGRGKVTRRKRTRTKAGITPAWAGKSHAVHSPSHGAGDHPRVGGEKPRKPTMSRKRHRITPAWAGKRCRYGVCAHRGRDHPRVGGEKLQVRPCGRVCQGSPPRGRGKASCTFGVVYSVGITPAWAGKRGWMRATEVTRKDHPRVGGEKSISAPNWGPGMGSPPRGRGKDLYCQEHPRPPGITPAWAGKRFQCPASRAGQGDHPRVGGEKYRSSRTSMCTKGSPPRGRGKALRGIPRKGASGITPAWAGKRDCGYHGMAYKQDHPRVGGEKQKIGVHPVQ